ncbi:MAG: enoyl-CoA hydratase/isomerase family protein [Methanobacteriota archaeon]
MPATSKIEVVRDDGVAMLLLDNPPLNLVTRDMIRTLVERVAALEKDGAVRTVVVTGAGARHFSGGLDMHEWAGLSTKDAQEEVRRGQDATWALEHLTKPTVAAIQGMCRGAGLDIALACDVRFAADDATFSFPEVDIGWMPSHGGTARLHRVLGRSRSIEILLAAKAVRAIDALRLGLVDHLAPSEGVLDQAKALARTFAEKPPAAVRAIKRALVEGEEKPYRNRFVLEAQHATQLLYDDAYKAAVARAREKRP